jgi:hypothetical protein
VRYSLRRRGRGSMLGTERLQKIESTANRIRKLLAEIAETNERMAALVEQQAEEENGDA